MILIIIGIVIVLLGLYFIGTYNSFQVTKTRIQAAVQEIGNQLKRQADLIPNLVESTKGYMGHEKAIFDQLVAARQTLLTAASNPLGSQKAVAAVSQLFPQFLALAESNPELKADGVVMKLMNELRDTSDKLMYSRRTVIDLTADFNTKLVTFPTNLIAKMFGFTAQKGIETPTEGAHLTVTQAETESVQVKL